MLVIQNNITKYHLIALAILFNFLLVFADTSYAEEILEKHSLFLKGFEYEYSKIPVDEENESGDFDYYGKITVKNREGFEIYKNLTNFIPRCDGGFPALSTISLGSKDKNLVVFCGNLGGGTNTLKIFERYSGFVTQLNFGRNRANLKPEKQNNYSAIVFSENHVGNFNITRFNIPTFYELNYKDGSILFSDAITPLSKEYYESFIKTKKKEFLKKRDIRSALEALAIAVKLDNKELYCNMFNLIDSKDRKEVREVLYKIKVKAFECKAS